MRIGTLLKAFSGIIAGLAASSAALAQVHSDQPKPPNIGIQIITSSDLMSCASLADNYHQTSACKGDAGVFQTARLIFSVEAMSSALKSAGFTDDPDALQGAMLADVAKFGPEMALTAPAMNLVDIAALAHSPFGEKGPEIAARAMISLEYLYPGLGRAMGHDLNALASQAGVERRQGPENFTAYMEQLGGKSAPLQDFRVFGAPPGVQLLVQKITVGAEQPATARNLTSDFIFPTPLNLGNSRAIPFAYAFAEIAARAQAQMLSLVPGITPTPASTSGAQFVGDAPFRGGSCRMCKDASQVRPPAGDNKVPAFDAAPSLGAISATMPQTNADPVSISDGVDLLNVMRSNIETRLKQLKEIEETVSKQVASNTPTQDEACRIGCAVQETAVFLGQIAAGGSAVLTKIKDGEFDSIRSAIVDWRKTGTETLTGKHARECQLQCEKDMEEANAGGQQNNDDKTDNKDGGKQTEGTQVSGQGGGRAGDAPSTPGDDKGGAKPGSMEAAPGFDPGYELGSQVAGGRAGGTPPTRGADNGGGPTMPKICPAVTGPDCGCLVAGNGAVSRCVQPEMEAAQTRSWLIMNTPPSDPRKIYIPAAVQAPYGSALSTKDAPEGFLALDMSLLRPTPWISNPASVVNLPASIGSDSTSLPGVNSSAVTPLTIPPGALPQPSQSLPQTTPSLGRPPR
ncbi:hypothetical protein [Teichococcus aestuarii]|uniref:hypothetical protein n=1 Tax=Teichococcus aestuarii TaxID=568898 RepID=UPI0011B25FF1|nr:hypothetical protein [Pseudoroseomonas aestuarii]